MGAFRARAALLCVVSLLVCQHATAHRGWLRKEALKDCQPEQLPEEKRCQYVKEHRADCAPRAGLLDYLSIYYCWNLQYLDSLAVVLVLLWTGFLFLLMFTASDRFFCPAMELLSEYLRLSPAVAGATLLALGNGAPDVFTQIAAASAGGAGDVSPESLSMALSEPLGTGLFVGNVVLGLTIAMARGLTTHVALRPAFFMKDVLFYLAAVSTVLYCMVTGFIHLWQCILLIGGWLAYITLTIWLSRDEERVMLDPLHHEVPRLVPFGPWDDLDDVEVEDWNWLEALPEDCKEIWHAEAWGTWSAAYATAASPLNGDGATTASRALSVPVKPAYTTAAAVGVGRTGSSNALAAMPAAGTGTGGGGDLTPGAAAAAAASTSLSQRLAGLTRAATSTSPMSPSLAHYHSASLNHFVNGSTNSLGNGINGTASYPRLANGDDGALAAGRASPPVNHQLSDPTMSEPVSDKGFGSGVVGRFGTRGGQHRSQPGWLISLRERRNSVHRSGQLRMGRAHTAAAGERGGLYAALLEHEHIHDEETGTIGTGESAAHTAANGSQYQGPGHERTLSTVCEALSPSATPSHTEPHAPSTSSIWAPRSTGKNIAMPHELPPPQVDPPAYQPTSPARGTSHYPHLLLPSTSLYAERGSEGWSAVGLVRAPPNSSATSSHPQPQVDKVDSPQRDGDDGLLGSPDRVVSTGEDSRLLRLPLSPQTSLGSQISPHLSLTATPRLESTVPYGRSASARRPGPVLTHKQTIGAFDLYKSTSSRYAYGSVADAVVAAAGSAGSAAEPSHPSTADVSGHGAAAGAGGAPRPVYQRSTSFTGHHGYDEHTVIPLLLHGKLQELSEHLDRVRTTSSASAMVIGSAGPGSVTGGSPTAGAGPEGASPAGCSPPGAGSAADGGVPFFDRIMSLGRGMGEDRVASQGPPSGGGAPAGADRALRSYTEQELAHEQKRLLKMLYWGHKQKRKESASSQQSPSNPGTPPVSGRLSTPTSPEPEQAGTSTLTPNPSNELSNHQRDASPRWSFEASRGSDASAHFSFPNGPTAANNNSAAGVVGETAQQDAGAPAAGAPPGGGGDATGDVGVNGAMVPLLLEGLLTHPETLLQTGDAVDKELTQEVVAGVNARVERVVASRNTWSWQLWRLLRRPLVVFLSWTMPMIERRQELHYSKTSAVLLPIVGPTLMALYAGWWVPWSPGSAAGTADLHPLSPQLLQAGLLVCCGLSLLVLIFWPSDGLMRGPVLGVFTVLSFVGSMLWMNVAADELVGLLVAVGHVMELPAALLGATVLAWGNSLSDTVSNLTMARDGYPTMAITACFASPLFILLAGVACTLSVGAWHGPLRMPRDVPTLFLYCTSTFNMLMWALAIPLIFRFKLDKRITFLGVAFYAAFQLGFVAIIIANETNKPSHGPHAP